MGEKQHFTVPTTTFRLVQDSSLNTDSVHVFSFVSSIPLPEQLIRPWSQPLSKPLLCQSVAVAILTEEF